MLTKAFFDALRQTQIITVTDASGKNQSQRRVTLYGDGLSQSAVDGLNALEAGWSKLKIPDIDVLAYAMATAMRECTKDIDLSIREIGRGAGKKYGVPTGKYGNVYYGRGFPQWTWDYNYVKADKLLPGYDFYQFPDKILDPSINVTLFYTAALKGTWTGVGLRNYITPGVITSYTNMVSARHVINGLDHADEIACNALAFRNCLQPYGIGVVTTQRLVPATITPVPAPVQDKPAYGLVAEIARLFHRT